MVLGASGGPPRSLSLTDFIFYFFIFPFLPVLSYDFFLFFFLMSTNGLITMHDSCQLLKKILASLPTHHQTSWVPRGLDTLPSSPILYQIHHPNIISIKSLVLLFFTWWI